MTTSVPCPNTGLGRGIGVVPPLVMVRSRRVPGEWADVDHHLDLGQDGKLADEERAQVSRSTIVGQFSGGAQRTAEAM